MPYQLPPELKTSKLESLPDDLRAIAEAALAKKFDIPEITPAKKKPAPEKPKQKIPEPMDWDDRFEYMEIIIATDQREMRPPMFMVDPERYDPSSMATVQVEESYRVEHYHMMVDQRTPHYEIARHIETNIHNFVDELRRRGIRINPNSRDALQLKHRGLRMSIMNMRDIEEFVQRSRVGGYGRY